MTIWLKKRLAVWVGVSLLGGALLWNGGALRAQSKDALRGGLGIETPRIKLTRERAARRFVDLMEYMEQDALPRSIDLTKVEADAMWSSFSSKSEREFGVGLMGFLTKMAWQSSQPEVSVRVQSETSTTATVTVEKWSRTSRPLILIQENGSWGVDVFETYALWNGIKDTAKSSLLATLTKTFSRDGEDARRISCQYVLRQLAIGISQYRQDYDEKYPPAKPWVNVVTPYASSENVFHCPSVSKAGGYGYAYNFKLSNKPEKVLSNPSKTVSIYETTILKRNVYGIGENLAFRHLNGANYAFADGHVKWLPKTQIPSFKLKP